MPVPRSTWPPCGPTCGRCVPARPARPLMAVVKSDAYGHGAVPVRPRRASRRARPGSAPPRPRRRSRCARRADRGRLMCWLWTPGGPWRRGDRGRHRRVGERDVGAARGRRRGPRGRAPARVQLKADTGLGRNGCQPADWPELVAAALRRRGARARSRSPGCGRTSPAPTSPGHPSIAAQLDRLPRDAWRTPSGRGCAPRCGTSPTPRPTLTLPESPLRPGPHRHRRLRHLAQPRAGHARPTSGCAR